MSTNASAVKDPKQVQLEEKAYKLGHHNGAIEATRALIREPTPVPSLAELRDSFTKEELLQAGLTAEINAAILKEIERGKEEAIKEVIEYNKEMLD